jgi:hypothetical protein
MQQIRFVLPAIAVGVFCACSQDKLGATAPEIRYACPTDPNGPVAPGVGADCAVLDFGDVDVGTAVQRDLHLGNLGRGRLLITSGALSANLGGVFSASASPSLLEVDQTAVIHIDFAPTMLGPASTTYVIQSNDPKTSAAQVQVKGNGVGHAQAVVLPTSIDFGDVLKGTTVTKSLRVTNSGNLPMLVRFTLQQSGNEFATALATGTVVPAGQTADLAPSFTPDVPGEAAATITIITDSVEDGSPTGFDQATSTATLAGRSIPVIQAAPPQVDFGTTVWHGMVTQTVTLGNQGKGDLFITGIRMQDGSSPSFTFTINPLDAGRIGPSGLIPAAITIIYSPPESSDALSNDSGAIEIDSNDPVTPTLVVPLTGACTCQMPGPIIQVTPTSIDFDTVGTNMDRTQTVTVANVGQMPLTVSSVALGMNTPSDFVLGTQLMPNTIIMPGDSTTFTIQYVGHPSHMPSTLVTGTVQVMSNDPVNANVTINMQGICSVAFAGVDGDGDGIPDECDLCLFDGPTPPSLPNTVTSSGLTITNGVLNGRGNIYIDIPPGGTITTTYDWSVTSGPACTYCPDCITQYYGTIDGSNAGTDCFYNDLACFDYSSGSQADTLTAPTAEGTYYVGFNWSWEYYCRPTNYGGHVGRAHAYGVICVKDQ